MLTAAGQIQRRVRYKNADGTLSREFVESGTFVLAEPSQLAVSFDEDGGYKWKPLATLKGLSLSLDYPDPADGPNIVETYTRQPGPGFVQF
jgi:hypothetical protein